MHPHLDLVLAGLAGTSRRAIGYPAAPPFDPAATAEFRHLALNNCGDPFAASGYRVNTHAQEREVVEFFAGLYGLDPQSSWGYVTTGGTEGNLWGLYLARERLGDAVVVTSKAAHYSVRKSARLLRMDVAAVETSPGGEVAYGALKSALDDVASRKKAAIVVANVGTTMTGAVDDLACIHEAIGRSRVRAFVHADAALAGLLLPFVLDGRRGKFFALGADSVSVSGHKILGTTHPCGVVVTRRDLVESVRASVEYIGGFDATISGSRSGLAPLALWHAIRALGHEGLRKIAWSCIGQARKLEESLETIGWPAARRGCSNIVVVKRPSEPIVHKWQLAAERENAHVVALPHLTDDVIRAFAADLVADTRTEEERT